MLAGVTEDQWVEEEKEQLDLLNDQEQFDLAFDEQHSRPQRFTYGCAPFSTCTLMTGEGVIVRMDHVDETTAEETRYTTKSGSKCKSKAKLAHLASFEYIRDYVGTEANRPKLRYLTCDQASDGRADAELILRAKFPEYEQCFDLWHKVYPMTRAWRNFVGKRRSRKKHDWMYPWLKTVHDADLFPAHVFKSWWVNCSHVRTAMQLFFIPILRLLDDFKIHFTIILMFTLQKCEGSPERFKKLWLGAARYYVNKYWPEENDTSDSSSESEEESEDGGEVNEARDEFLDANGRWKREVPLEAKWIDGEFYHGEVTRVHAKGTYSFRFDDEDFLRSVPHNEIRLRTDIVPFGQPDIEVEVESESESEEAPSFGSKKYYVAAVREFLESQLDNHEYFVHGTRTNNTESFHNVCNKYYQKGLPLSFPQYIMRKTFAALDWNENKKGLRTDSTVSPWKARLLREFVSRKTAIRAARSPVQPQA